MLRRFEIIATSHNRLSVRLSHSAGHGVGICSTLSADSANPDLASATSSPVNACGGATTSPLQGRYLPPMCCTSRHVWGWQRISTCFQLTVPPATHAPAPALSPPETAIALRLPCPPACLGPPRCPPSESAGPACLLRAPQHLAQDQSCAPAACMDIQASALLHKGYATQSIIHQHLT